MPTQAYKKANRSDLSLQMIEKLTCFGQRMGQFSVAQEGCGERRQQQQQQQQQQINHPYTTHIPPIHPIYHPSTVRMSWLCLLSFFQGTMRSWRGVSRTCLDETSPQRTVLLRWRLFRCQPLATRWLWQWQTIRKQWFPRVPYHNV